MAAQRLWFACSLATIAMSCASCGGHAQRDVDTMMHNVADHADTNRETMLDGVAFNLTSSSYLGSSTLTILGRQQLRPVTPGVTDTWARFTVRLHDGYANGPAGQPTEIDACYQLDYNYYGLASTENLSC